MKKHNLRATFYITTSQINYPGKLSWKQIEKLYREGNEIGSHSHTHPQLTKISNKYLDFELRKSKQILNDFQPKAFAYPCGDFDKRVIGYVKKYYSSGRGYYDPNWKVQEGINFRNKKNLFSLKCIKENRFFKLIRNEKDDFWAIFAFHGSVREILYYEKLWLLMNFKLILRSRKISLRSIFNSLKMNQPKLTEDSLLEFESLCNFLSNNSKIKVLPVSEVIEKFY